jgi:hypothetical protein
MLNAKSSAPCASSCNSVGEWVRTQHTGILRLLATRRIPCNTKNRQKEGAQSVEGQGDGFIEEGAQSVEGEGDGFIEEDCSVDWSSPPIYDTYPDEEVSSIHQVDFFGVNAILSKTFNQSCDEIYGTETAFLSESEWVFVSYLGIFMAYGKGEAQKKHDKSTPQSGVWGFHDNHRGMSMMKSVTFIMGCDLVVILRNGE